MASPVRFNTEPIRWTDPDDDTAPLKIGSSLTTRFVPKEGWKKVEEAAAQWLETAKKRSLAASQTLKTSLRPNTREIHKLESSETIIFAIYTCLSSLDFEECEKWDSVLVCEDCDNKIQGIALFHIENNALAYLATHPDNIITSHRNLEIQAVKGVGSKIILELASIVLRSNEILHVKSTHNAQRFYEKLGFERDISSQSMWLNLSPKRIMELIAEKIPPFHQLLLK